MIQLIGIDIGSTTTSCVLIEAELQTNAITGKTNIISPQIVFAPDPVYTPFFKNEIDQKALKDIFESWSKTVQLKNSQFYSAGVIITGLAAAKINSELIYQFVDQWFGNPFLVAARDPLYESWLAFMGRSLEVSRNNPNIPVLNLDIGGGTTNIALGIDGEVQKTACLSVGARHFVFDSEFNLQELSPIGKGISDYLDLHLEKGQKIELKTMKSIAEFMVSLCEKLITDSPLNSFEASLCIGNLDGWTHFHNPIFCFSGGVGRLMQEFSNSPPTKEFSHPFRDLGEVLAYQFNQSDILKSPKEEPFYKNLSHSTVLGICLNSVQISGKTTYLSKNLELPMKALPVIGTIQIESFSNQISQITHKLRNSPEGLALKIEGAFSSTQSLKQFAQEFRDSLCPLLEQNGTPLVLFVEQNIGKTLGSYLTNWQNNDSFPLMVIDELIPNRGRFVSVAKPQLQHIPVSFYA